jgi:hypothetical protein
MWSRLLCHLSLTKIQGMERRNPLTRGAHFADYFAYTNYVGASLQDIFTQSVQKCHLQSTW